MSMKTVIIGGGPGGYVAAVRLAQLGAEVVLVEKEHLGGTCLNVGCIPTKVLLHTAEAMTLLKEEAEELGLLVGEPGCDWQRLQERKEQVVGQLVEGVRTLLNSGGVRLVAGTAAFTGPREIEIHLAAGGKERIGFDTAIIATGSAPAMAPIPGIESECVVTSTGALSLERVPESLAVIGGGVIGCEFANIYGALGAEITIIEMLPDLIPNMDQDIVHVLKNRFVESGMAIHTNSRVLAIRQTPQGGEIDVEGPEGPFTVKAEKVLLSIGRRPVTGGLGLEALGVAMDRGFIRTDDAMRTSLRHIYAIGDCRGGALLAHTASAEGIVAAEHIMKKPSAMDFRTTPYCVYTKPELAGVGLTEKEAQAKGHAVSTGIFPLYANGKSLIMGESYGIVKYVADKDTGEVLGLHMAGPRATDLIVEGALALRLEATVDEIATTIHAHPTVGEALHEAAHAVHGNAIHLPK